MTENNETQAPDKAAAKHTTGRTSRSEAAKHAAETRRLRKVIVPGMFVGGGQVVPEQREEPVAVTTTNDKSESSEGDDK